MQDLSQACDLHCHEQQHQNRSLSHRAGPGIEPESPGTPVRLVTAEPQRERQRFLFLKWQWRRVSTGTDEMNTSIKLPWRSSFPDSNKVTEKQKFSTLPFNSHFWLSLGLFIIAYNNYTEECLWRQICTRERNPQEPRRTIKAKYINSLLYFS